MTIPADKKKEIVDKFCDFVAKTDLPVIDICDEIDISPYTIYLWAEADKNIAKQKNNAMHRRGWRYAKMAREAIESAQTTLVDAKGNLRDHNSSVNKAKCLCDFYMRLASVCAPETFGDLRHEIKEIQKEISELKKLMADKK